MAGGVSRRRVLEVSGAALGAGPVAESLFRTSERSQPAISGWVTKGQASEIAGRAGVVESFRHSGSSLCNDGSVYRCRTCAGVEFYLLVPTDSPQPTVDGTYQFGTTDETNVCGNFRVELRAAEACGGSESADEEPTTDETPAEEPPTTTDTTTETTTEKTPTEAGTDTTTETPTEEPTPETPTEEPTLETPTEEPIPETATGNPSVEESARSDE